MVFGILKPKLYLETTIFSYLAARKSHRPMLDFRQDLTRRWWDEKRTAFELCASVAVVDECLRGDATQAHRRLALLDDVFTFPVDKETMELAGKLVVPGGFPSVAGTDIGRRRRRRCGPRARGRAEGVGPWYPHRQCDGAHHRRRS